MVSIVDLGMVGDVAVDAASIRVELLPTFVGCPALELIRDGRRRAPRGAVRAARSRSSRPSPSPWTSDRITPAGRAALAAAGIAPPSPARRRPLPVLRLGAGRDGQRVRADAVPVALLLPRRAASRSKPSSRLTGGGADPLGRDGGHRRRRDDGGRHRPGRARGRPRRRAVRRRPGGRRPRRSQRIRDGLARRAARLDLDPDCDRRLGRRAGSPGCAAARRSTTSRRRRPRHRGRARGPRAQARRSSGTRRGARDPTTILATNTSALSVAAIAAATGPAGAGPRAALLQPGAADGASSRSSSRRPTDPTVADARRRR